MAHKGGIHLVYINNIIGNMSNTEIATEVYKQNIIPETARNIKVPGRYFDDFVQECYLSLLKYPTEKLNQARDNNQLRYLIVRIVVNTKKWDKFARKYYRYDNAKTQLDDLMYQIPA